MTINRKKRSYIWDYTLEYFQKNERKPISLSELVDYVASKGVYRGSVYPYVNMFLKSDLLKIDDNKLCLTDEVLYKIKDGHSKFGSLARKKKKIGRLY